MSLESWVTLGLLSISILELLVLQILHVSDAAPPTTRRITLLSILHVTSRGSTQ